MPDLARAEALRLRDGYGARVKGLVVGLAVGLAALVWLALELTEASPAVVGAGALVLGVGAALLVAGYLERLVLTRERALLDAAHRMERPTASPPGAPPSGSLELAYDALLETVARIAADRDRFESAVNGIDAGVIAIDAQDRVTVANPALRDLFGLTGDPLGRDYTELVPSTIEDCVVAARDGRTARLEFEPPGDERKQYVAYAAPRDLGGGVAVVIRDITSIRLLERVRRDFVANVSHELRT
ncbi:MAG: PAS domain-containing protein, partial [Myxococcales bacterium]|nr:PAS domain-containing protein [Myxococcales bacterium]